MRRSWVIAALALLGLALLGGIAVLERPMERGGAAPSGPTAAPRAEASPASAYTAAPIASPASSAEPAVSPVGLAEQLEEFKASFDYMHRDGNRIEKEQGREAAIAAAQKRLTEFYRKAKALADALRSEPEALLAFIRAHEGDLTLWTTLLDALTGKIDGLIAVSEGGHAFDMKATFAGVPAPVRDELRNRLLTGPPWEKTMILQSLMHVSGVSLDFLETYVGLVSDPDPDVQTRVMDALQYAGEKLPAELFPAVRRLASRVPEHQIEVARISSAFGMMARMETPEAGEYLLERLANGGDDDMLTGQLAQAIDTLMRRDLKEPEASRYADAIGAALSRGAGRYSFSVLVQDALSLPAAQALAALERGRNRAATPKYNEALETIIDRVKKGDSPDRIAEMLGALLR